MFKKSSAAVCCGNSKPREGISEVSGERPFDGSHLIGRELLSIAGEIENIVRQGTLRIDKRHFDVAAFGCQGRTEDVQ